MTEIKAVIFDMDGVLIDSEPLWRKAMIKGFTDIGISFTEEDCRKTTGLRFKEVVNHWFNHHQITHSTPETLDKNVIFHLIELINHEGAPMKGAIQLLEYLDNKNIPIGLATSSSHALVDAVLNKISTHKYFKSVVSAEFLKFGKPHPEVFLKCADDLGIAPKNCLVIEDSVNGLISAKAAQMTVIAVPDSEHKHDKRFAIADHCVNDLTEIINLF